MRCLFLCIRRLSLPIPNHREGYPKMCAMPLAISALASPSHPTQCIREAAVRQSYHGKVGSPGEIDRTKAEGQAGLVSCVRGGVELGSQPTVVPPSPTGSTCAWVVIYSTVIP